jgi:hypothetical protein
MKQKTGVVSAETLNVSYMHANHTTQCIEEESSQAGEGPDEDEQHVKMTILGYAYCMITELVHNP